MGHWFGRLLASLVTLLAPAAVSLSLAPPVTVRPAVAPPAALAPQPAPPALAAWGVAVVDVASGSTLYQRAGGVPHPLASVTKLMTALVVADRSPDWGGLVTVRETDGRGGGRVALKPGEQVSLRDLFEVMLVASSNEAAVALVRATGLTPQAFTAAMNRKAQALGLPSVRFVDPAGLEPDNIGSADDVARLARFAWQQPQIAAALRQASLRLETRNTGEVRTVASTNVLLARDGSDSRPVPVGGKTGYLDESGYNLVMVFSQAGHDISVAVLGAPSAEVRWEESSRLARWAFASFRWPALGG